MNYPVIQPKETGSRIKDLMYKNGYKVKDIQYIMGFENPRAVYKWLSGSSLPSIDNLLILSRTLNTPMENILVIKEDTLHSFLSLINYFLDFLKFPLYRYHL